MNGGDTFSKIQEVCSNLEITKDSLFALKEQMMSEIQNGLKRETHSTSSIKCSPAYVQDFPSGCEHGHYLTAKLSSSSLHLSLCYLSGEKDPTIVQEQYLVTKKHWQNETNIFDYMANCLQKFVKMLNFHREPLGMAVVFCFPIHLTSLTNATLTPLTSNYKFDADNVMDLGQVISSTLKRHKLRIQLLALLSDATGVLLGSSPYSKIGLVVGTKITASYVEKTSNIEMYDETYKKPNMIINIEWGGLDTNSQLGKMRNDFDRLIDENSLNKGQRLFEKMISSFYIAELARCILIDCTSKGYLFNGAMGRKLMQPFSFTPDHVVRIIADDLKTFENTRLIFDSLGVKQPTLEECIKVMYIIECVTRRSAALVATAVACLLEKIGEKHVVIGIDDSFYRNNQVFQKFIMQCIQILAKDNQTCELKYVQDASDKGAAILAAITMRKTLQQEYFL